MTAASLVLIGPMGAGKTSIGRKVAKALGRPFYDSDTAVIRAHGPIPQIFAEHGEDVFRAWEREAVSAGLARGGVVSLGGGAVLDADTQTDLAGHRVALLTVEPRVVAARVSGTARPLLGDDDGLARWEAILKEREPVYRRLADRTFDTSHGPLQRVVEAIAQWVRDEEDV
ncbi:shikimate kinase [Microbacterium xanthum]|uniref:shikimate kinase n=1 Tax=Microbacterium xanthum TaxID=3079794 RepID=UPI002AD51A01|nr:MULTISPECIES: shikimate kinase [unclassified Microbacterium]MDZ8172747.1 shikimate kinase [Microbacterium sp. KSW-48]MDZ8202415.1 shikimate kinase [Microbacterium sp. SSW1-59]